MPPGAYPCTQLPLCPYPTTPTHPCLPTQHPYPYAHTPATQQGPIYSRHYIHPLYTERPICDTGYMTTNRTKSALAALALAGAAFLPGIATCYIAPNATAAPLEDEPGFSCVDDGNRVCGPGNSNGVPAGCYDDGGVLFKAWPCEAWSPASQSKIGDAQAQTFGQAPRDGYRHGDGTVTLASGPNAYDAGDYVGGYN